MTVVEARRGLLSGLRLGRLCATDPCDAGNGALAHRTLAAPAKLKFSLGNSSEV